MTNYPMHFSFHCYHGFPLAKLLKTMRIDLLKTMRLDRSDSYDFEHDCVSADIGI